MSPDIKAQLAESSRKLAESDALFRSLVDSVQDYAIFALGPHGHVATWNAGAERIKGYTADEIIGAHFSCFYPPEDVAAGKCEMELEGAARHGSFEDEGWRVRKDGSRFWANVIISAIRDGKGELTGFSKVTRDLTERKKAELERAARHAAEEANRTKDQFLAMLGHELRNPLAPIVSALQLLKLRGDPKSTRELQVIERQVRQMTRLVDDLLDVSRVGRGTIELRRAPIDLRDVLAKAAEIAIPMFEKKGQHFEVKTPSRPLVVDGDDARLVQVFANLLANASKYTHENGHIWVLVRQVNREILVEVRDDGRGITADLLPRVFDLFVQGHQQADRPDGGLGLGLTLSRSLVELHGGTIGARSDGAGLGSSFTVRLPAVDEAPVVEPEDRITRAYGHVRGRRRILIVDDNEDALVLLADILTSLGHEVMTAPDGPAALATLGDFSPEVAILDLGLPGMDGYQLAQEIRKKHERQIKLLALSGYGQSSDRARSKEVGFDVHLVKPIDVRKLLDHLTPS